MHEGNLKLLFLDDQVAHQQILRKILDNYDFVSSLVTVSTPEEARNELKHNYFNSIIVDFQLPGCTGLEFLQSCRDLGHHQPAIILTGNEHLVNVEDSIKQGVLEVVSKFGYFEDGALDTALDKLRKKAIYFDLEHYYGVKYIPIVAAGEYYQVPIIDIFLIETKLRGRTVYTSNQSLDTEIYITVYEKSLVESNFHMASRQHLVNLLNVERIEGNFAVMKPNLFFDKIKITRKEFKEAWESLQKMVDIR